MNGSIASEKLFRGRDYLFFGLLTLVGFTALIYFMEYWFSFRDYVSYPITFFTMTFLLVFKISINQFRWFLLPFMKKPSEKPLRSGWKVGVATTFVPGAEPIEMLEETVRALVAMDYPHETWVLDEGDDALVKALCLSLGARHFSRKNLPPYQQETGIFQVNSKYGNYNAWLHEIGFNRYDILVAFDPDHVPVPAFLTRVLGHFNDPRVGYVQAPQVYYNQKASFIARGAAEESYSYYSCTQMASYAFGYPVVTGCHNSHRVKALRDVGGFAPHDADDLLVTLLYRSRGWQGVYVPEVLAKGLTPVDWNGYLAQQLRWARSVLDVKLRFYPKMAGSLTFRERVLSFLHGISYVEMGITTFMGLILAVSLLVVGITPQVVGFATLCRLAVLCAVLQLCDFYRQRFYLDRQTERGLHWRAGLLKFAKWPFLLMALCDAIRGHQIPYVLTRKVVEKSRRSMLFWPHALVVILIGTAWMTGMLLGNVVDPLLRLISIAIMAGSLALILTDLVRCPDPYDRSLSPALLSSSNFVSDKQAPIT
jgi:cellulose synthase (UDP-forming)